MRKIILALALVAVWSIPALACQHSVVMIDTFGDGWNGGFVDVYVNGSLVLAGATLPSGPGPITHYFNALSGDDIDVDYTPGSWSLENEYWVYDGGGTELCHEGAGYTLPGDCLNLIGYCPPTTQDWGDLPDPPYETLNASGGATHVMVPGILMGALIDGEVNGLPTANADGDDLDGTDDEDGVTFSIPGPGVAVGTTVTFTVDLSSLAAPAYLNVWADQNANGFDGSDWVVNNAAVGPGGSYVGSFTPTVNGQCGVRFRLCTLPTGAVPYYWDLWAPDGEVEDYLFNVVNCCTTTITTFPYNESFESGFGAWVNFTNDQMNWTRWSGSTGSVNTGPTSAQDGTYYIYLETSTGATGYQAILGEICFDATAMGYPVFTFWRHMYGAAMGTLELQISNDNCSSYTTVWSQSGNQGNQWDEQVVTLYTYGGSVINARFVGTRGTSFTSDMAIDNISFDEIIPPNYCVDIGVDTNAQMCNPSATVYYNFTVENCGLLDQQMDITATGNIWTTNIYDSGMNPITNLWVPSTVTDTFIVEVIAGSSGTDTVDITVECNGDPTVYDMETLTTSVVLYLEPFDVDPVVSGWTLDAPWAGIGWEWGPATAVTCSSSTDPSYDTSPSGNENVLGYYIGGCYLNNMPATEWATSPVYDFTNMVDVQMIFQRWLGVESSSWDHAYIEVSNDMGGSWTQIFANGTTSIYDSSWQFMTYDIASVANDQATVQVRFGLGTTDSSVAYSGWNIDDLAFLVTIPGWVSGTVTYDGTTPLAGALVELDGTSYSDVSAGDGTYTIACADGVYDMTCSAVGYCDGTATGVTVTSGATTVQDFDLLYPSIDITYDTDYDPAVQWPYGDTRDMTITNIGSCDLDFTLKLIETTPGPAPGPPAFAKVEAKAPVAAPVVSSNVAPSAGPAPLLPGLQAERPAGGGALTIGDGAWGNDLMLDQVSYWADYYNAPNSWTATWAAPGGSCYAGDTLQPDREYMYLLDYSTNQLFELNLTDGSSSILGTIPPTAGHSWSGVTIDPDGNAYASCTNIALSQLWSIDLTAGTGTLIGSMGSATGVIDIAFNPGDGMIYADCIVTDSAYVVDPSDATTTLLGSLGMDLNYAQGADFDDEDERWYLAAFNLSNFTAELREVDLTTGYATLRGTIGYYQEIDCWSIDAGAPPPCWVVYDIETATLAPTASQPILFTFDSSCVPDPGSSTVVYTADLEITTNDIAGLITVPMSLTVTNEPAVIPTSSPVGLLILIGLFSAALLVAPLIRRQ